MHSVQSIFRCLAQILVNLFPFLSQIRSKSFIDNLSSWVGAGTGADDADELSQAKMMR
jgi:hypothetical protein